MTHRKVFRFQELSNVVGFSRSTIDRLEKANQFPKRIMLGKNSIAWYQDEIDKWLKTRISGKCEDHNFKKKPAIEKINLNNIIKLRDQLNELISDLS